MHQPAVLLCGHGSRDPDAIAEFEAAAAALQRRLPGRDVAAGYLEFARPTIGESLAGLAARGARRIVAAPAMLLAAAHVKRDLPAEVDAFKAAYPEVEVRIARDLASEPKLLDVAAERIAAAAPSRRGAALLLVVGRGASDPAANATIAKQACLLRQAMGFAEAASAFSGIAHPRVDAALDGAARRGFEDIVVLPYFLFAGVLVKRIQAQTAAAMARFPAVRFVMAGHLGCHPAVIDAFSDRIAATAGEP